MIGAGVIGLAIARTLAIAGHEVVIVERERHIGSGISSRNSEVIHAGLYYAPGSFKARFCVEGRERLYDYCASRHIAHKRCGKLIVAPAAAGPEALEKLAQQALANGVTDLWHLSSAEAKHLEPALACGSALLSPSTGIVDVHGFMLSLLGEAQDHGAAIAHGSEVVRLVPRAGDVEVEIANSAGPVAARVVVNAAGLGATAIAHATDGLTPSAIPRQWLAKGHYFSLSRRCPFRHLIYPLHDQAGLGIHLTLDLAGEARFGPDVEWVDAIDYDVPASREAEFRDAVRTYWPGLPDGALVPGYAGIRPKIAGPGESAADFHIADERRNGAPGVINLFGIESPGLTASLALAEHVATIARSILDA
ncbi:MAG TPA: NAD(P)/FAD-dependent oxidoreductase [Rhizomicrobium sp.]|nr:NAD(P)/FAD-dependent oxidoreductase [Rhizomicrobium sp.]